MKVLIIGGTGVISRAIVEELIRQKHEVTIFNRGNNNLHFTGNVNHLIGDKKNEIQFMKMMVDKSFDVVIDMICFNQNDAKTTIKTFKNKVMQMIFTSSTAAYARPYKSFPISEVKEDLTNDHRFPYGFFKAEMERYLNKEINDNKLPITIIRPSLTYGVGAQNIGILRQNYGIIDRIKKGKPLIMFGDGSTPWNFTFAHDLAKGYVGLVGNKKAFGNAYHITNDTVHIWEDLYLEIGKIIGITPTIYHLPSQLLVHANPDLFSHLYYEKTYGGCFDNTRIKTVIANFKTTISLNTGLKEIINWFEQEANYVDPVKDGLEDKLVELYQRWSKEIRNIYN